jgi:hypothetical protein
MQDFTGNAETNTLALMLQDNVPVKAPLDFIKAQKLMEVEKLIKTIMMIHVQMAEEATRDRKSNIQNHNNKTHEKTEIPGGRLRACHGNTARAVRPSWCVLPPGTMLS